MSNAVIRILLIDDHNLFRSGVRQLLQKERDLEIVAEAADGLEGLKRAKAARPDVILLDLNMPGLSGLETLHLLTQDLPDTRVIILTVSEEADELGDALRAGACGYLTKNIETDTLVSAIRKAVQGQPVISDSMTLKLVEQLRQQAPPAAVADNTQTMLETRTAGHGAGSVPGGASGEGAAAHLPGQVAGEVVRLTAREREIVQCLSRGESNKEIARNLGVAESTVKIHVQNILKKLHLTSRVQVAVYAVEHGLSGNLTD
ncbi:MAG: response regulator transcription factor [Lautropia sp.]|nr:response regulator transcription factor [Lautropia sp.]